MGTRAQFFVGDPRDLENREWLGTIAWDGYPDGDCAALAKASSEVGFRALVKHLKDTRRDFCDPAKNDFPFPWKDDLFLTDCTYALFDGAVQYSSFHTGFIPLAEFLAADEEAREAYFERPDSLPEDVPAPSSQDKPPGPDSIMVLRPRDTGAA